MKTTASIVTIAIAVLVLMAGCGKRGAALPPEPRGPFPPLDLELRQIGDQVQVTFDLPAPRSRDKLSQTLTAAFLVRVDQTGSTDPPDPDRFRRRGQEIAAIDIQESGGNARRLFQDAALVQDESVSKVWWYGVRLEDRRGRSSPLAVAGSIQPVAFPNVPEEPQLEMTAEGVRLRWATGNVNIYRAVLGNDAPRQPINHAPVAAGEYLDTTVTVGETYSYVLRTAAAGRNPFQESESSPAGVVHAVDLFPPAPPTRPVAVQEGAVVRLFWDPNTEKDLAGYRLYRKLQAGDWKMLQTGLIPGTSWIDPDVHTGDRILYRVTAVDLAEPVNESGYSEEVSILVALDPESAPAGDR
jgi:hypothetical protein